MALISEYGVPEPQIQIVGLHAEPHHLALIGGDGSTDRAAPRFWHAGSSSVGHTRKTHERGGHRQSRREKPHRHRSPVLLSTHKFISSRRFPIRQFHCGSSPARQPQLKNSTYIIIIREFWQEAFSGGFQLTEIDGVPAITVSGASSR
jgi:hypothetical protein